jgi:SAM-dependent methyltransferase
VKQVRNAARRSFDTLNRLVFPEASSAADQWQRVVMDSVVDEYIDRLGPERRTAVEISGDAHADKQWKRFDSLNYPDFDLCNPTPQSRTWDVVICEQVLEHVIDPFGAAANLRALCSEGGHVIVTTPFLIKVHELPLYGMNDYWRFTPRGLRVLLEQAGLRVDTVGTWGNRLSVVGNLDRWSARRPWHSMGNNREMPVVVWAFARNLPQE